MKSNVDGKTDAERSYPQNPLVGEILVQSPLHDVPMARLTHLLLRWRSPYLMSNEFVCAADVKESVLAISGPLAQCWAAHIAISVYSRV